MAHQTKNMKLLLLTFGIHGVAGSLPWPVSSTYNSVNIDASIEFMINMMGAIEIPVNITVPDSCDAV